MNKSTAETIAYAIRKECQKSSLCDWCEEWGITIDEFEEFLTNEVKKSEENEWIPVSSGVFPSEDNIPVQITYLGYHDKKSYCDAFACYRNGNWYWLDIHEKPIAVEVVAWRYNCEPYKVV